MISGWLSTRLDKFRTRSAHAHMSSSLPEGTIIYAIGDIHGRLDLLQQLEEKIERDAADVDADQRVIVCLGDYIDRGDDSRGVIEHLVQAPPQSFERVCLTGNHEDYLLRFLEDSTVGPAWLLNGGRGTLMSYCISPPEWADLEGSLQIVQTNLRSCMPEAHVAFLRALELSYRNGDYLFVHAGIRPNMPLSRQDPHDLIWIREEFVSNKSDHGAVIVHGHSVRHKPDNLANRIGVDTGAYATGRLTCVVLSGSTRRFLTT